MEACWTLVNIAANSLDFVKELFCFGLMPVAVDILDSNLKDVIEPALWIFSNISASSI